MTCHQTNLMLKNKTQHTFRIRKKKKINKKKIK